MPISSIMGKTIAIYLYNGILNSNMHEQTTTHTQVDTCHKHKELTYAAFKPSKTNQVDPPETSPPEVPNF